MWHRLGLVGEVEWWLGRWDRVGMRRRSSFPINIWDADEEEEEVRQDWHMGLWALDEMVNDSYEFTEGRCSVDVCGGSRECCCHIRLRCGFVKWRHGGFYFVSLEVPAWSLSLARAKKWLSCSASLVTFPSAGENGWIVLHQTKNGSLKVPVWSLFLARAKKWLVCPRSGELPCSGENWL